MKERPILFSGSMVRALLDGTKTQTRRVVKDCCGVIAGVPWKMVSAGLAVTGRADIRCPYGAPDDRLWVRETWNWFDPDGIPTERRGKRADFTGKQGDRAIEWVAAYAADGPLPYPGYEGRDHWRPSIHMPRWASRITLDVVGVRVERLQDISEQDALAEGVTNSTHLPGGRFANENYAHLWDTINGDGSWEANPWVWVVEFKRVGA